MDWPVRWTKSGYRYVSLERVAWIDFRPCYRCTLPAAACAGCDRKALYQQRKRQSLDRQRERAYATELCAAEPALSAQDAFDDVSTSRGGE